MGSLRCDVGLQVALRGIQTPPHGVLVQSISLASVYPLPAQPQWFECLVNEAIHISVHKLHSLMIGVATSFHLSNQSL